MPTYKDLELNKILNIPDAQRGLDFQELFPHDFPKIFYVQWMIVVKVFKFNCGSLHLLRFQFSSLISKWRMWEHWVCLEWGDWGCLFLAQKIPNVMYTIIMILPASPCFSSSSKMTGPRNSFDWFQERKCLVSWCSETWWAYFANNVLVDAAQVKDRLNWEQKLLHLSWKKT